MKLEKIFKITARLHCQTGLHIGGGDAEIHIGGIDNQVIKHPVTHEPYIPGSSLKGKIRSLMEWRTGMVQHKPFSASDWKKAGKQGESVLRILQLFGIHGNDATDSDIEKIGPTRLSFWDCPLNKQWLESIRDSNLLPVEAKTENTIDRIAGTALHPRQTERVPAGADFEFLLSVKKLDTDNEEELLKEVLSGLKLLELDSLGGSGSRGYGKVVFQDLKIEGYNGTLKFEDIKPFG